MASKSVLVVVFLSLLSAFAFGANTQRLSDRDILNMHNYYRCLHGTQPLTWDNGLAASAQEWAYNRQNNACVMQHSGWAKLGENVAAGTWRGLTGYNYWLSEDDVVNGWYHEPFTYGSSSITINHFTQVLWQGTTRVGCSWASCNASQYEFWVCQYTPQGNIMNAATINQNVPRPCRTRAQCEFVLQGVNLLDKFTTTDKANTALTANQIDPSTYNYAAQTCLTPTSAYTAQTTPMCIADSTVLPKTIDVTVQNPTSTGPLTVTMNCPSGIALSGTGLVTCQSGNVWNIAGTCGGAPVTAAPNPNTPPPPPAPTTTKATPPPPPSTTTPAPADACWGPLLTSTYLSGYAPGWVYQAGLTKAQAKAACLPLSGCKGITQTADGWDLRAGSTPFSSTAGENSILRLSTCVVTTKAPATAAPTTKAPTTATGKCWGSLLSNKYLYQYPTGYTPPATSTLAQAQAACNQYTDCGGVTWTGSRWEARKGTTPMASTVGESSYLVVSCGSAAPAGSLWSPNGVAYKQGQCVQYNNKYYICQITHTSMTGWDPVSATALWKQTTTCPASSAEVQASIQERVPWLIPVVAVIGVLVIAIAVVLYKKHKSDRLRMRAYSGDLGTPDLPTTVTGGGKVEETTLTTATDQPPELEPAVIPNQPTYSQIPTSPTTNQNPSQAFPMSPSTVPQPQEFPQNHDSSEKQSLVTQPTDKEAPLSPQSPSLHPQLSSDWETRTDPASGQPYYYNRTTGVTQWEVPDGA